MFFYHFISARIVSVKESTYFNKALRWSKDAMVKVHSNVAGFFKPETTQVQGTTGM